MTAISEIEELEEKLRQAELAPDPKFFEEYIDDEMIFVADGKFSMPKIQIVKAHEPGGPTKFRSVDMTYQAIVDHGDTVVVTCTGLFEGPNGTHNLGFMRIWSRKPQGWRIVAGSMI